MAISNITPASTNVIEAGDTFAFDVDDTYTSMVIEVETASGWEYAYDSALGGQQTGYTVVVADDGAGTHTFTVGRDSGFDLADTNVKVTEDETGSSAETSFSYSLASQQLFPQGKSPYFSTFAGTLRVTDAGAAVRSDVGWIDLVGFDSVVDNGNGKVTVTVSGGGGSGDVVGPASVVDDRIAAFDGTTGKLIKDGAKLAADVVTGPASVATADVAIFSGTSGKIITDGTDVTISSGSLSLYGTTADVRMRERTTGPTIVAAFGGLWIKDDAPTSVMFRDDAAGDWNLSDAAKLSPGWDGALLESASITITESGGTVSLNIEKNGGGDLTARFGNASYNYDTSPADSVALSAGTDIAPTLNYVWLSESGGTVSLNAGTSGFPATAFCAVATVLVQSAATVATDGAYKVHAWTDHVAGTDQGHVHHMSRWIRRQHATWNTGVGANAITTADPDAYLSTDVGTVFQLHDHTFPARSMSSGDPLFLVNDPTTAYKKITTLDDITQDASGGAINNKWMHLVIWGSVNEVEADCKIYCNLPTGTYNSQALAEADGDGYAVFDIPTEFVGCGFLIANYVVQAKTSGLWVHGSIGDLRGLTPASSPSGAAGLTDHGALAGLADDDHTQYVLADGLRAQDFATITERNTAPTSNAGFGYIWVKDTSDSTLVFTDDASDDRLVITMEDNDPSTTSESIPIFNAAGQLYDVSDLGYSAGKLSITNAAASLQMTERTTGPTVAAAQGEFWVKDDAPTTPRFTDDAGTDSYIGTFAGNSPSNNYVTLGADNSAEGRLQTSTLKYTTGRIQTVVATDPRLSLRERTTAGTLTAAYGDFWVKDDVPNTPMFTDDAGTDHNILGDVVGPAASSNQGIARWSGATGKLLQNSTNAKIDGNSKFTLSGATAQLAMLERATPPAGTAGYGDFWVQNDAPTTPMFTDDASTDYKLVRTTSAAQYSIPWFNNATGQLTYYAGFGRLNGGIYENTAGACLRLGEGASPPISPSATRSLIYVKNSDPSTLNYQDGDSNEVIVSPAHSALTLGAAATTFAIVHPVMTITGDGGANTLATITGAGPGQILTLIFVDALVTVTDDNTHAADSIDLSAAFTSADDTVLQLVYDGTSWYEISRSVN